MTMNEKLEKITSRIASGYGRIAAFHIRDNTMSLSDDGMFFELDGELDYADIATSFDKEKANLEAMAKDIIDNFQNPSPEVKAYLERRLPKADFSSITEKSFKIIHDENGNHMYLFLPKETYLKQSNRLVQDGVTADEVSKAVQSVRTRCSESIKKLIESIKLHGTFYKSDYSDNAIHINFFTKDANVDIIQQGRNNVEKFSVQTVKSIAPSKRNDSVFLKIKVIVKAEDGEIIYNKIGSERYMFNDYELKPLNKDNIGSASFDMKEYENKRRLFHLETKMNEDTEEIIKLFQKDIAEDDEFARLVKERIFSKS